MTTPEKQKEQKRKLGVVIGSIFWLSFIFLIFCVLPFFLPVSNGWKWLIFFLGMPAILICLYWLVYFRLAPDNLFWTLMEEGTSKTVMKGGQAVKGLIQWKSHILDGDWNVVIGEKGYLFGGLRFYGIWPIKYIDTYSLRWTSAQEDGKSVPHQEVLDAVLLKEKIYAMKIEGAEDENRVPLDIEILVTLKVVNPYKARFVAEDYLELVLNRTGPLFREYTAGYSWEELIAQKQRGQEAIWERLEQVGLVTKFDAAGAVEQSGEFERDYGVRIKKGGIEIKSITPPSKYQEASTKEYLAGKEAKRIAGETAGAVVEMMAKSNGITPKEMQEKINKSPRLQKEFREYFEDLIHRKIAIEGGSFLDVRVGGAEGLEKAALNFASVWQKVAGLLSQGPKQNSGPQKRNKKRGLSREEKMERLKEFKERGGKLSLTNEEDEEE